MTRQEFESLLNSIFITDQCFSPREAVGFVVTHDGNRIPWMRGIVNDLNGKINNYLAQYDAASTQTEKDAVVGSVVNNYVCPVRPAASPDTYKWPTNEGLLGGIL